MLEQEIQGMPPLRWEGLHQDHSVISDVTSSQQLDQVHSISVASPTSKIIK